MVCRTNLPASNREKSRISFSSSSNTWALERTVAEVFAQTRRQVFGQRQIGHADDRIHRRAQLVTDVRQEFAFGAVGAFGRQSRRVLLG